MPAERFLDTNILLYGYDLEAGRKRLIAMALMELAWQSPGSTAISVQVLQEFFVNFTRQGQTHAMALKVIEDLSLWPVIDNTVELIGRGLGLCKRFKLSLWDAMIVSAAKASGARELVTEDLNHGQDYEGVVAINPFVDS